MVGGDYVNKLCQLLISAQITSSSSYPSYKEHIEAYSESFMGDHLMLALSDFCCHMSQF